MLTVLNGANPREIIVIGLTETSAEEVGKLIAIDAAERENIVAMIDAVREFNRS